MGSVKKLFKEQYRLFRAEKNGREIDVAIDFDNPSALLSAASAAEKTFKRREQEEYRFDASEARSRKHWKQVWGLHKEGGNA